jgi:hypothetical protein
MNKIPTILPMSLGELSFSLSYSALISNSNNENNAAAPQAAERPTVKVKPDHILKKPASAAATETKLPSPATPTIRESDLRRIRIVTGSGAGRKMAVRDRSRRLTNGDAAASRPTATAAVQMTLPPPPQRAPGQRHQVQWFVFSKNISCNKDFRVGSTKSWFN